MNYPSNSNEERVKATAPEVKKVVTGNVKTRKKGELKKISDNFLAESAGTVKNSLIYEVLIPNVKKVIEMLVTEGISMIFWGSKGSGRKSINTGGGHSINYVSYGSFSDKPRGLETRYSEISRNKFDIDDIIFENRGDAEDTLDNMGMIIEKYGFVSVSDLYDMIDQTAPFTANKFGWTTLATSEVVRGRDGYMLKLPKPRARD